MTRWEWRGNHEPAEWPESGLNSRLEVADKFQMGLILRIVNVACFAAWAHITPATLVLVLVASFADYFVAPRPGITFGIAAVISGFVFPAVPKVVMLRCHAGDITT